MTSNTDKQLAFELGKKLYDYYKNSSWDQELMDKIHALSLEELKEKVAFIEE